MLPPEPSPSNTRAIVIFIDDSLFNVTHNHEYGSYANACIPSGERHKPGEERVWPTLPLDEEFLRIVLLRSRIAGRDVTVEPYKSYRDELEWRRTDKYVVGDKGRPMTVEQVYDLLRVLNGMDVTLGGEKHAILTQVRHHLCSHKRADGTDATVGVPVSGERWCDACRAQFD